MWRNVPKVHLQICRSWTNNQSWNLSIKGSSHKLHLYLEVGRYLVKKFYLYYSKSASKGTCMVKKCQKNANVICEFSQRYNSPVVTTVVLVSITILISGSILAYIVVFNVNGSTSDYIKSVWFGWAGDIFSRTILPVWITAFYHTDFRTFIFNTWHDLWSNVCLHKNRVQPILWCLGKKWKYWQVLITETDTDHHRHIHFVLGGNKY